MDNAEKLQEVSRLVSEQISLEEFYRLGKFNVPGEQFDLPVDLVARLKQRFVNNRQRIIELENSITG